MPDPKIDRRILRTQKLYWEVLIILIQEKTTRDHYPEYYQRRRCDTEYFLFTLPGYTRPVVKCLEMIFHELSSKITSHTGENFVSIFHLRE